MTANRRLAAILAADVVGYSRLMGEDEAGTAKAVRERREAATHIMRAFGGRMVKTTGDGALLEFPSVVAAVECAIAIQKMMAERNAGVPEPKRILYRIGVNLGDILIDGEDILGDGVNVAARLEAMGEPGGICLSGTVYDHVRGKIEAEFSDLGEPRLKNIAGPVRVFGLTPAAIAGATVQSPDVADHGAAPTPPRASRWSPRWPPLAAALAIALIAAGAYAWHVGYVPRFMAASVADKLATAPRLSIVVLPFENLSGDPEQDYFADEITDDLTTDLSHLPESFVISRSTAFTYKGKAVDAKGIGRELGVRYLLEGSVRRVGEKITVNAQLISVEPAHIFGRIDLRASAPISASCSSISSPVSPIRSGRSWSRRRACGRCASGPAIRMRSISRCRDGRSSIRWIRRKNSAAADGGSSARSLLTRRTSRR